MKVDGVPRRSIQLAADGETVEIVDQTRLPHRFEIARLASLEDAAAAILDMKVRGAPLIGATAAYGLCLAVRRDPSDASLEAACATLGATRPTAVNLRWALDDMRARILAADEAGRAETAYARAGEICDEDVAINAAIGAHGLELLRAAADRIRGPVDVLTHCNAGWLATVDGGTALAPIYRAHDSGIDLHVWVDETRPRNQGAGLTAWELAAHGVPHTVIVDNAGGHLMREGRVDLCITGTDRTCANGDVCNKIGTYLKALAAFDNDIPFYVALPGPTVDWTARSGDALPIEERAGGEVATVTGQTETGEIRTVRLTPAASPTFNPGFDVTPARLVTGLITERGVAEASADGLLSLYPERRGAAA
jgi:methylthioribose-1-phosphate isomerase